QATQAANAVARAQKARNMAATPSSTETVDFKEGEPCACSLARSFASRLAAQHMGGGGCWGQECHTGGDCGGAVWAYAWVFLFRKPRPRPTGPMRLEAGGSRDAWESGHLFGNLATRRGRGRPGRAHGFASPPCDGFALVEDAEADGGLLDSAGKWNLPAP